MLPLLPMQLRRCRPLTRRVGPFSTTTAVVERLRAEGVAVIAGNDENSLRELKRRSRDFFWYSPILKKSLEDKVADCVAVAKTEACVVKTMRVATATGTPVVVRGAGSGNYGQAVPLRGGVVLDVSQLTGIVSIEKGACRAWAGTKLGDLEDAVRKEGWELRQHPSTRRMATIGGFAAGGSTGHGGVKWGQLHEIGAILGLRVVLPNGDILEVRGHTDIAPFVHAYGTTGVATQVEVPLSRAQPWRGRLYRFQNLQDATEFAWNVARAPALDTRGVSVFQAPLSDKYLDVGEGDVVLIECAENAVEGIDYYAQSATSLEDYLYERPIYENGWNHTTLHALKKNKQTTYLQALSNLSLVAETERHFPPTKLLQHLECVNSPDGIVLASLALLFPDSPQDLESMLEWHRRRMPLFDPHTYDLEDGGMKDTSRIREFKATHDTRGVMNPGKLRETSSSLGTTPRRYWAELSTEDAKRVSSATVAVLPIGAVEAHGPHLPLGTDATHNESLLSRALELLPADCEVLALPPMPVGVSSEHTAFAGTLTWSPETALRAWFEIAASVRRSGVRKLVVYNSHGGNHPLAEVLARKVRLELDMLCVLAMDVACCPDDLFSSDELRHGIHGGALETSLMLWLAPSSVRKDKIDDWPSTNKHRFPPWHAPGFQVKSGWLAHDLNPNGVVGASLSESTRSKGAAIADANVARLVELLVATHKADLPALRKK